MIYVLVTTIIVFFPISVKGNVIVIGEDKKIYFNINLFSVITIIGGNITLKNNGIKINLKKKSYFLSFKSLLGLKNKVKPLKDYHVIKLNYSLDIGGNDLGVPLSLALISNFSFNVLSGIISAKKPYLRLNGQTNLFLEQNMFNLFLQTTVLLNIFMLILSVIKILGEKLLNVFKKS